MELEDNIYRANNISVFILIKLIDHRNSNPDTFTLKLNNFLVIFHAKLRRNPSNSSSDSFSQTYYASITVGGGISASRGNWWVKVNGLSEPVRPT